MNRRNFIRKLTLAAGYGGLGLASPNVLFAQSDYSGKLLFNLQLDGGMGVTSFCDPKVNQAGEREINIWARSQDIQSAGNINYAPFAANADFFTKYHKDMLVVNGVDAQTNSHTVGVIHNWSGRNANGYPSLTALHAATNAPTLPLAYLNFGGFGNTEDMVRSSRISDVRQIQNLLFPNADPYNPNVFYNRTSDFERIKALQLKTAQTLAAEENIPAGQKKSRRFFAEALSQADGLKAFADTIPSENQLKQGQQLTQNVWSTLHQQMQISLLAASSGVTVAADLIQSGFDSHSNHDREHTALLNTVADAIDYFWTYAEELGIANRIVLVVGSDFGRTPHYNSGEGKDHWPVSSFMVMERNAAYTNRTFGETDGGHNTYPVNLKTGKQDYVNGATLHPKHIHLGLRKHLGLDSSPLSTPFPFNNTEEFSLFSG
ncbi:MAG: DUF1501 domain-containing protein [Pseudohongiellaceae bacterium]